MLFAQENRKKAKQRTKTRKTEKQSKACLCGPHSSNKRKEKKRRKATTTDGKRKPFFGSIFFLNSSIHARVFFFSVFFEKTESQSHSSHILLCLCLCLSLSLSLSLSFSLYHHTLAPLSRSLATRCMAP
ncbi:hypothetical protein DFJ73DRAFT_15032 [Zopfochytrium polystomum]|nr:hypothetical protein DFJ73DRAFT_15032 [Zopfochytrium polystomum]